MERVRRHYESLDAVRRGVCLLNAGDYRNAIECFDKARRLGCTDASLPALLASALLADGRAAHAAHALSRAAAEPHADVTTRIRHALTLWSAGRSEEAVRTLRDAIERFPDCAELHFQLGTLLAAREEFEEAEMRFLQAANIDRSHTDALVSLAMCCGVRNAPGEAVACLQRAQRIRPHDARIGWLLAQAAEAARQAGCRTRVRAVIPPEETPEDTRGIEELSNLLEAEPDYVDAFLAIPEGEMDRRVFAMLHRALETALRKNPDHPVLHCQCGRVLERLGRDEEAIRENEQAVRIDPRCVQALIELGKLYQKTDRNADATTRLEQAVQAGGEYADVYYLLGNLYQVQGLVSRARTAYRKALLLNDRYEAASKALAALPVS